MDHPFSGDFGYHDGDHFQYPNFTTDQQQIFHFGMNIEARYESMEFQIQSAGVPQHPDHHADHPHTYAPPGCNKTFHTAQMPQHTAPTAPPALPTYSTHKEAVEQWKIWQEDHAFSEMFRKFDVPNLLFNPLGEQRTPQAVRSVPKDGYSLFRYRRMVFGAKDQLKHDKAWNNRSLPQKSRWNQASVKLAQYQKAEEKMGFIKVFGTEEFQNYSKRRGQTRNSFGVNRQWDLSIEGKVVVRTSASVEHSGASGASTSSSSYKTSSHGQLTEPASLESYWKTRCLQLEQEMEKLSNNISSLTVEKDKEIKLIVNENRQLRSQLKQKDIEIIGIKSCVNFLQDPQRDAKSIKKDISIPIAAPTESSGPLHYFPSTVAKTGARQLYKMWKNHHSEELLCLEQFGIDLSRWLFTEGSQTTPQRVRRATRAQELYKLEKTRGMYWEDLSRNERKAWSEKLTQLRKLQKSLEALKLVQTLTCEEWKKKDDLLV
ncbi:GCR1_C domain-containing protein [Caenorhabditis elegans]|uniref:GCR1_C domain-containing protein n=1 Tax=Caenorhabditis elegans TaxID=6239 RepID=A0A486WWU5_CAEEL|nr:GCR1_C domain-containing protein [Caenorhabditis elegans]VGM69488.1 GCR1_C domain-containing protein [Caenorhabditis elegans]